MVASNLWFSLAHKGIQPDSISVSIQLCVCVSLPSFLKTFYLILEYSQLTML